ncbi:amidase [Meridianimarinicoccus sp. MJW13]|uniref:amidase n=1 Tax=Meridianimarinicoccus sp. MJW13 TaxID=2720031 RepID=UPI001D0066BA|nr:amidase [Fluviibacterium sp. MJW13]
MTNPVDLTLPVVAARLRDGRLTAETLAQAHLDRIAARDEGIGAFVHLDAEAVLAAARSADTELACGIDRGPLHGICVAIKDIFDVAGWPVRYGSRLYPDRIAATDCTLVTRLRTAGAVPLGLVATYDLAIVGPGDDGLYPQPRNPWDPARVTGGSSSGVAAAIAAGMVRVALGSDTGGSVRSPSAYCGIVGLKPTHGGLPLDGVLPLAPSFDVPGAMGRTVVETALLFGALRDDPVELPALSLDGKRIGYDRTWSLSPDADPQIVHATDAAASTLSLCGAEIRRVTLPPLSLMTAAAAVLIHAEGLQTHRAHLARDGGRMGRMAYQSMAAGAVLTETDIAQARRAADLLRARIDALLQEVDALILPTTLTPAPAFADFADGLARWSPMCTLPFSMTGHPALSVPMGFADGLPLGLQIAGRHDAEPLLLQIAAGFEHTTDHGALDAASLARHPLPAARQAPVFMTEETT